MTLDEAHQFLCGRLDEMRPWLPSQSAWVFVCAASYLEYLAKIVDGRDRGAAGYKAFIQEWLAKIRPAYRAFRFRCGKIDLPTQMYHVLRCGMVHSFSLIPDKRARIKGGRDRSIVLCHRPESSKLGLPHLSPYTAAKITDAALFVADDFLDDLSAVTDEIFRTAKANRRLARNIGTWLRQHPPLRGGF